MSSLTLSPLVVNFLCQFAIHLMETGDHVLYMASYFETLTYNLIDGRVNYWANERQVPKEY